MSIRSEVSEFVANGPLPGEDAGVQTVARAQALLERIQPPLTDDEAHALAVSFGPDDSYGLGWSLLHLIESAPGARTADYSSAPRSSGQSCCRHVSRKPPSGGVTARLTPDRLSLETSDRYRPEGLLGQLELLGAG